jgi:NADPH-dependent glutamate synthase beta subunit-like oxidoreductase
MQWGIPSYSLPDAIVRRPIKDLADARIQINANTEVTPDVIETLLKTHDAVIAAHGAPVPQHPDIPGVQLDGVVDATTFLRKAKRALSAGAGLADVKGEVVAVLGGSNTALDVARSVLRLGGKPIVVHRREERFSRARPDEIAEAKREGVQFRFSTNITRLEGENGRLKRAVLVRTVQKKGGGNAETMRGTEQSIEVNMVVLATGYGLDPAFSSIFGRSPLLAPPLRGVLPERRWLASGILAGQGQAGRLAWEREYGLEASRTPKRGRLWLVGDALVGPSTVVGSMAQGKLAARAILESTPHR